MRRRLLTAAALVVAPLLWTSDANANSITINGGESPAILPPTTLLPATGSPVTLPLTVCCGPTNSFTVEASAEGTPSLPLGSLDSNNIVVNSTAAGTLVLWFTETGLTAPLGSVNFTSSLTANALSGAISSVTLSTFISPTDVVSPPNGTPLDSHNFTTIGTQVFSTTEATGAGPYSLQEVYTIHATGVGNTNLTIDLSAAPVPEPASLVLFGSAFAGLGLLRRRRKAV